MAKLTMVSRILLGLIFLVFGVNGLVMAATGSGFIPMPPPSPEMGAVFGGLFAAKYLMPLVKIIEVITGLLFLFNKKINLALVLMGPIVVNILGLHLFVDLSGAPIAIVVTVLWLVVLKSKWSDFKNFLCE